MQDELLVAYKKLLTIEFAEELKHYLESTYNTKLDDFFARIALIVGDHTNCASFFPLYLYKVLNGAFLEFSRYDCKNKEDVKKFLAKVKALRKRMEALYKDELTKHKDAFMCEILKSTVSIIAHTNSNLAKQVIEHFKGYCKNARVPQ